MFTGFDVVNASRTAAFKAYKRMSEYALFWEPSDPEKLYFYVGRALELRDFFLAVPDYSAYKVRFYKNLYSGWDVRTSARAAEFEDYFLPRARYVGSISEPSARRALTSRREKAYHIPSQKSIGNLPKICPNPGSQICAFCQ